MAPPLSHDKLIAILKAEGVRVAEYPGWRTRERDDETGKTFGPVHMILNHHTAGRDSLRTVAYSGRPGLPAPLAHIHLAKSGLATMCSGGRANHAGLMARNAYDSFYNESSTHPAPSSASGTIDGNDVSYGIETENLGDNADVYPRKQYDAWVRINAAFCRHYGWSAESAGCHKETSIEGKVDPRGPVEGYGSRGRFTFTPKQFRADVAERLKHSASWSPGTTTTDTTQEDPMAGMTPAQIADAVLNTDGVFGIPESWRTANPTNKEWKFSAVIVNLGDHVRAIEKKLDAQQATGLTDAQLAAVADQVAAKVAPQVADLLAARLEA